MKEAISRHFLMQAMLLSGAVLMAQYSFFAKSSLSQTIVPETGESFSIPLNGELTPDSSPGSFPGSLPAPEATELSTLNFSFTNTLEYGDCLEVILKLYEGTSVLSRREQQSACLSEIQENFGDNQLSKPEALRLVSTANLYATTFLNTAIYPVRGQRVRIARFFGFIYEIDANDAEIRELAAQAL